MKNPIFVLVFLTLLFASGFSTAANLEVQKIDKGSVVITELDNPARFDLIINNKGTTDNFEIYSLVSVSMTPTNKFGLPSGETKVSITATPDKSLKKKEGYLNFEYEIKGENSGIFKDGLMLRILPLKRVLEIGAKPLHPDHQTATVIIKNKENTNIQNLKINFDSIFFSGTEYVSLEPYEEKNITFAINKKAAERTTAGPYIVKAEIETREGNINLETVIQYLEKEGLSVEENNKGFIIREKTIAKKNYGNVPVTASIDVTKNIISRLFTTNSPEPSAMQRNGLFVTYHWEKEISPAEIYSVTSKTNYTIPFIIIILAIITALIAKMYSTTAIMLTKKTQLIKTKHGEFALKIIINAKAKKHVDKIQVIDSIPAMSKLYEKFGIPPTRIDQDSKRLFWNIDRLSKGESRVFSYVVYSKMNVVGRFELPTAMAVYEREGKTEEVFSNKAYFVAGFAKEN